jgi:uncharacterized protein YkwD
VLSGKSLLLNAQAIALLTLASGCFAPAPADERQNDATSAREATPCVTPEDAERMADQVLQLINLERAERADQGLQPVVVDPALAKIAGDYACRMVEAKFFGHRDEETGHGPAERATAGKYTFFAVGENLAAGPETAVEVMKLWMESESHRKIILDPSWKDVGIAARAGGEHGIYWVLEFGDPAKF